MTEPLSERIMWWAVFAVIGVGVLSFVTLFVLMLWGIFAGAPVVPRQ